MFFKLVITGILSLIIFLVNVDTKGGPPDMCLHSSRFDSMTQFLYIDNNTVRIGYFVSSDGYYWTIKMKEYPTDNNTKGRLPHQFRGDAAFFREWKRCEDQYIVPMIVVVDSNGLELKYIIYFVHNETWTQPFNASEDKALSKVYLYDGLKTVDTIINFANIKTGLFADKLGDESIFIISSAQNNSIYYDWVGLTGCLESNGSINFKGSSTQAFGGLLAPRFWPMNKSIDAAMIYTEYPNDPNLPEEADISLFQENTHYQFTVPLISVQNKSLICDLKTLSVQYYSTWMGCADGLTPEPPLYLNFSMIKDPSPNSSPEPDEDLSDGQRFNSTPKWRPALDHTNRVLVHSDEDKGTFLYVVISAVMVIVVASLLLLIIVYLFVYTKDQNKD